MNLAWKNILNSMNWFISPCGSGPSNLFQITVILFMNTSNLKQSLFNLFFDCPHIIIFLWPTEIRTIIASNYCNSTFWWILFLRIPIFNLFSFWLPIIVWIFLFCFSSFWIWFLFIFKCLDIWICFSFHLSATIFK